MREIRGVQEISFSTESARSCPSTAVWLRPQLVNSVCRLKYVLMNAMVAASFIGVRYFVVVFSLAFAMGVARTLIIAPQLGETPAVLLEVPIIVGASWVVARRLIRHRSLSLPQRAAMGIVAFTLTMVSEAVLSALMRGQSVADWAAVLVTPLGLVGLAAQAAFAVMPILAGLGRVKVTP